MICGGIEHNLEVVFLAKNNVDIRQGPVANVSERRLPPFASVCRHERLLRPRPITSERGIEGQCNDYDR